MRRWIGVLALVALPWTACSFHDTSYRAGASRNLRADHVAGSAIHVETANGRIEVVAEPDRTDVLIEARIRCTGRTQVEAQERLAAADVIVTRDADRRLVVVASFPGSRRGRDGASVKVRVPDAHGAHLDTSNGSVVVSRLSGELVIETSNGSVRVTDHDGAARIKASNGRVTLTNVGGSVEANTSNSPIELTLAGDQRGPLELDTSNGSITVKVGPAFVGSVAFDTSNGSIHVDDPDGRISSSELGRNEGRIMVGEGGPASRLDTSNGSIRFRIGG